MKASEYRFSSNELRIIREFSNNQRDARLQKRFLSLIMLSQDLDVITIARILSISIATIERWFKIYLNKGPLCLNSFQYKPKYSFLNNEQLSKLINWVKIENPTKLKAIVHYAETEFSIKYSVSGMKKLLNRNGIKVIKPKTIPGSGPSVEEQLKQIELYHDIKNNSENGSIFLSMECI